jgi:predicted PurR-regulated permease PerM
LERPAATLSAPRIVALSALALLPVIAALALWFGQAAFFLLFAGILFAAMLDAATRLLVRATGLGRRWAVGAVIGAVSVSILLVTGLGGTYLIGQANELFTALREQALRIGELIDRFRPGTEQDDSANTWMGALRDLSQLFWPAGGTRTFAIGFLGALANAFVIFFIGLFLVIDPGLYARGFAGLFPAGTAERIKEGLDEAGSTLRRWLIGRLLSMGVTGLFTLVGLLLIGYPLAVPLALLATVLAFVPNLGPILTYVPIAMAGFSGGLGLVAAGMSVYALVQFVESYVLTPLIQKRLVSLPPALILFAQVLAGLLFGLWGVALATPFTAIARVWVRDLQRACRDRGAEPGERRQAAE